MSLGESSQEQPMLPAPHAGLRVAGAIVILFPGLHIGLTGAVRR